MHFWLDLEALNKLWDSQFANRIKRDSGVALNTIGGSRQTRFDLLKDSKKNKDKEYVSFIISRINSLSGKRYSISKHTTEHILARLNDGHTLPECIRVVDDRWARWKSDERMKQYFNPLTLFRPSKFVVYLQEAAPGHAKKDDMDEFSRWLEKHGKAEVVK